MKLIDIQILARLSLPIYWRHSCHNSDDGTLLQRREKRCEKVKLQGSVVSLIAKRCSLSQEGLERREFMKPKIAAFLLQIDFSFYVFVLLCLNSVVSKVKSNHKPNTRKFQLVKCLTLLLPVGSFTLRPPLFLYREDFKCTTRL